MKHYRIRQLDEGGFFIARRTTFRTLQELVEHYSKDADGLCVNLCKPCVQVRKTYGRILTIEKKFILKEFRQLAACEKIYLRMFINGEMQLRCVIVVSSFVKEKFLSSFIHF